MPNLEPLNTTCSKDSSPVTYNTFLSFCSSENFARACSNNVDFPIPGAPPNKITDPETKPPPKTLSSSLMPVESFFISSAQMSENILTWLFKLPVYPLDKLDNLELEFKLAKFEILAKFCNC